MGRREVDFEGKTVVFEWDDGTMELKGIGYKEGPELGPLKKGKVRLIHKGEEFNFAKGDMLLTHASPGCYWYWNGTQWVLRCS